MAAERTDNAKAVSTKSPDGRAWRGGLEFCFYRHKEERKANMKNIISFTVLFSVVFSILIFISPVQALMFYHAFSERCIASDHILKGSVVKTYTESINENLAFTYYDIKVDQVFKGSRRSGAIVTIRHYGGPTPSGAIVQRSDTPKLQAGETYILFLNDKPNDFSSFAWESLGVFIVKKDGQNREYVTDYSGRPVIINPSNEVEAVDRYIPLAEFTAGLSAVMESVKGKTLKDFSPSKDHSAKDNMGQFRAPPRPLAEDTSINGGVQ